MKSGPKNTLLTPSILNSCLLEKQTNKKQSQKCTRVSGKLLRIYSICHRKEVLEYISRQREALKAGPLRETGSYLTYSLVRASRSDSEAVYVVKLNTSYGTFPQDT